MIVIKNSDNLHWCPMRCRYVESPLAAQEKPLHLARSVERNGQPPIGRCTSAFDLGCTCLRSLWSIVFGGLKSYRAHVLIRVLLYNRSSPAMCLKGTVFPQDTNLSSACSRPDMFGTSLMSSLEVMLRPVDSPCQDTFHKPPHRCLGKVDS
jgi:hypothetical protein